MTRRLLLSFIFALIYTALPQSAWAQLAVQQVTGGLNAPLGLVQVPSDPTAQVVLEQGGRIRLLKDGVLQAADYLDLSGVVTSAGDEAGLLGLAFSPRYADDGRVFVYFVDQNGNTVLSRFRQVADDALHADPDSRFDLIWPGGLPYIEHFVAHHYGGNLAFGPDGYLYIGLGDGDDPNDPTDRAQDPLSLQGKILRLDVSVTDADAEGYDVPVDNPFTGRDDVLGEIWALGLRNPWRWSFDDPARGGTGALVIGDVGQDAWEEVDYEPAGASGRNYGWPSREGANDNATDLPIFSQPLIDPLFQFDHDMGHSIIGGVVYRGQALGAQYTGRYFFGDFVAGQVWSLGLSVDPNSGEAGLNDMQSHGELESGASGLSSFGVDAAGELYLVSYTTGTLSRIVLAPPPPPPPPPPNCPLPDPYASIGGGTCVNGVWAPPPPPPPPPPPLPLSGDFDGDGHADLIWENTDGQVYSWFVSGTVLTGGAYLSSDVIDPNWLVVGTSDFTGDGKPDLFWQHQVTGQLMISAIDGTTKVGTQMIAMAADTPWRVAATGDFNNDGKADIIWQNVSTGTMYIWFMTSANGQATFQSGGYVQDANGLPISLGPGTTWRIVGTGDIDGDGKADVFWQDQATGSLAAWYMDGLVPLAGVDLSPRQVADTDWAIRAVGDYDGDGHPDLIWEHLSTGDLWAWFLDGPTMIAEGPLTPSRVRTIWRMVGAR